MQHDHEFTDIQLANRRTTIYVETYGKTAIEAVDGREGFLGEDTLAQSIDWTFDADTDLPLSLSVEREANGRNQL